MFDLSRRQRFALYVVVLAFCTGALVLVARHLSENDVVVIPGVATEPRAASSVEAAERGEATGDLTPERAVTVHVCGGVAKPGVYTLPSGSRVADAVEAAGGLTPEARAELVNMAMVLTDSSQVFVPVSCSPVGSSERPSANTSPTEGSVHGQVEPMSASGGGPGRININTASPIELDALPGVGPVLAQKIVDYRNSVGRFECPEQLLDVPGIGAKKYEALKDFVTVY